MLLSDFYKLLIEESKTSFIYSTASSALKSAFSDNTNVIYKSIQAFKKGIETAKNTLIYNSILIILNILNFKSRASHLLCLLISSYISGRRNGVAFAIKNAMASLAIEFIS